MRCSRHIFWKHWFCAIRWPEHIINVDGFHYIINFDGFHYSNEFIPDIDVYNFTNQYEHFIDPEHSLEIAQGEIKPEWKSKILCDRMRRRFFVPMRTTWAS